MMKMALYEIEEKLGANKRFEFIIGDVRDEETVESIMKEVY